MTNIKADSANDTNMPKTKTLSDCHIDAVMFCGMIEAIDLLGDEGEKPEGARVAVTTVALEMASRLADNLERLAS